MPDENDIDPKKNDKKDKVIHTRVPDALDEELKAKASNLGISVSNLIRNILNNAVDLIEDVIVDGSNVSKAAAGEPIQPQKKLRHGAPTMASSAPSDTVQSALVIGWQKLTLNVNALCSTCNTILPKGTDAAMGITAGATHTPSTILCLKCLKEIKS